MLFSEITTPVTDLLLETVSTKSGNNMKTFSVLCAQYKRRAYNNDDISAAFFKASRKKHTQWVWIIIKFISNFYNASFSLIYHFILEFDFL